MTTDINYGLCVSVKNPASSKSTSLWILVVTLQVKLADVLWQKRHKYSVWLCVLQSCLWILMCGCLNHINCVVTVCIFMTHWGIILSGFLLFLPSEGCLWASSQCWSDISVFLGVKRPYLGQTLLLTVVLFSQLHSLAGEMIKTAQVFIVSHAAFSGCSIRSMLSVYSRSDVWQWWFSFFKSNTVPGKWRK